MSLSDKQKRGIRDAAIALAAAFAEAYMQPIQIAIEFVLSFF